MIMGAWGLGRKNAPAYDWLESDGVAYVGLPFGVGCDLVISCDCQLLPTTSGSGLFGGYHNWGSTNTRYNMYCTNNYYNRKFDFSYGQPRQTTSIFYDWALRFTRHSIVFDLPRHTITLDGVSQTYKDTTVAEYQVPHTQSTIGFALFAEWVGSRTGTAGVYSISKMRLYSFSVRDANNNLLFDFEPRVIDGEAVVFDKVSQTALTTLGGGTFTAGRDET